jgi:pilus assembly protein CpaF
MFTIIISEKGGAERRETFDKNEINVGRVQGNDLMLPKGNVSKHHARLLFRDGRFIVTDLKSTNGTYVNGRKIAQATIVREGDKIYIGDFVLKLDTGAGAGVADESYHPPADEQSGRTPSRNNQPAPMQPAPVQMAAPNVNQGPPPLPSAPQIVAAPARASDQQVSHYPLERDPDEGSEGGATASPAADPRVPSPKVPPAPRMPNVAQSPQDARQGRMNSTALLQNRPGAPAPAARAADATSPPTTSQPSPRPGPAPIVSSVPARQLPRESPAQAGRRLALITLVDRVADVVELAPLKQSPVVDEQLSTQLDRAVREQAKAMRDEGEAPEGIDLELLTRDALRELVGLGPIGPLLEDDEVTEIHVMRHDYVLAVRGGASVLADASFTSEDALYRTIGRLAHQSGSPWRSGEVVVERRLSRGAFMIAIAQPAATGCVLVVRKRRRIESSLEDLVRSGALSRPMATFLESCVMARANVLVSGAGASTVASMLSALASAGPAGDRVTVLGDGEEISVGHAHVVSLVLLDANAHGAETVHAAARLRSDRLIVGSLAGGVAAATIDAIADGAEGVLAGIGAPSIRQALARVTSQIALARPGVDLDAAREAVGESFDVGVEAVRLPDGRLRVLRVAELSGGDSKGVGMRDLFTLSAEGAAGGEGAFVASGITPRFVNDFAARGIKLDPGLFKRTVGRS